MEQQRRSGTSFWHIDQTIPFPRSGTNGFNYARAMRLHLVEEPLFKLDHFDAIGPNGIPKHKKEIAASAMERPSPAMFGIGAINAIDRSIKQ
jgi:hypothetical protein